MVIRSRMAAPRRSISREAPGAATPGVFTDSTGAYSAPSITDSQMVGSGHGGRIRVGDSKTKGRWSACTPVRLRVRCSPPLRVARARGNAIGGSFKPIQRRRRFRRRSAYAAGETILSRIWRAAHADRDQEYASTVVRPRALAAESAAPRPVTEAELARYEAKDRAIRGKTVAMDHSMPHPSSGGRLARGC